MCRRRRVKRVDGVVLGRLCLWSRMWERVDITMGHNVHCHMGSEYFS